MSNLIEEGDVHHEIGEARLGFSCSNEAGKSVRLTAFSREGHGRKEIEESVLTPEPPPQNWFWRIYEYLKAFMGAHGAHTTLEDRKWSMHTWDNRTQEEERLVNRVLDHERWETLRQEIIQSQKNSACPCFV